MSEDTYKHLLSEFYGLNKEPSNAKKHLSSSRGIESFENVTDLECLSSEYIISTEETGKKQSTLEETERMNDEKNEDITPKSPHVLTVEEIFEENRESQTILSEPDIIEDQRDDKNIPTKNFARLEDTFTKAIAKVSESVITNDLATTGDNLNPNFNPVTKAKRLWRQKTMLSKENLLTQQNIFTKCDGIHFDLNNAGISDFPVDILQSLTNLQLLYLNSNNLMELPEELFLQLKNLKWLDVRNNQLSTIPCSIKGHNSLETLLLQGNNIEKLPLELGLVPNLKNLQTAHNPIVFPPKEILDLDSTKIINFLREEWNNNHPEDPVDLEKTNDDQIDKKPSTIICYQNYPKKSKINKYKDFRYAPKRCARSKSWSYKPSSRCQSAGVNVTFQQQQLWMNIAKNLLSDQTSKLQKLIDKSILEEWRYSDKFFKCNKDSTKFCTSPPYALHKEDSEKNFSNQTKSLGDKSKYKRNFKDFDELLRSFSQLDSLQKICSATPGTRQKQIQSEIEKIYELQKEIQFLKLYNDSS